MLKQIVNAVRRNHALEHATISVLLDRLGHHRRVMGRAAPDGFYIYGDVSTESLREFASEGLARLQGGEAHLAVSPLCGTNLAVAGLLAGLGSYLALAARGERSSGLPGALMAGMLAVVVAQPLGRLAQKHFTTSPELDGVRIVSVESMGGRFASVHKVRTEAAAAV